MTLITVIKRDAQGQVLWRYNGQVLHRTPTQVVLEAYFNRPYLPFQGITLKRHDRFIETYYIDRWYNLNEIYDRDDGGLKGWYCNISRPAELDGETVAYDDLALDLWVTPNGEQTVLDEDEFAALELEPGVRKRARETLAELRRFFEKDRPPV
jgi:protein associated with RNAse G/E